MSFAVWSAKPPFSEADLTAGEKIYQLGDKWIVTDGPAPAEADVLTLLAPAPDVPRFADDLKVALGGIVASNALAKSYPLFYAALQEGEWSDVQALILHARATAILSAEQYAAFQQLAAKHHIPITLP